MIIIIKSVKISRKRKLLEESEVIFDTATLWKCYERMYWYGIIYKEMDKGKYLSIADHYLNITR